MQGSVFTRVSLREAVVWCKANIKIKVGVPYFAVPIFKMFYCTFTMKRDDVIKY